MFRNKQSRYPELGQSKQDKQKVPDFGIPNVDENICKAVIENQVRVGDPLGGALTFSLLCTPRKIRDLSLGTHVYREPFYTDLDSGSVGSD